MLRQMSGSGHDNNSVQLVPVRTNQSNIRSPRRQSGMLLALPNLYNAGHRLSDVLCVRPDTRQANKNAVRFV